MPALLVSPLVEPGSTSHDLPPEILFDHTSIMKTIFARFCEHPTANTSPHALTDFQSGFYEMARLLRHAGLPGGHP